MTKRTDEEVRKDVARSYARAVERVKAGGGGCCSSSVAIPVGAAAQTAGYGRELEMVPGDAARASFGCGNPVAFAKVQAGDTVLDLGSGAGLDLLLAARRVGAAGRVIGVDMTEAMVEAARENAREAGAANVEVRQGLIEELPVEDASVDWVISNCVINLSPDKPAVFREIHRVLRPGGRFSISDIVAEDLPQELREDPRIHASCVGGAISEAEYRAGLEAAGLAGVRVERETVYDTCQLQGIAETDLKDLGLEMEDLGAWVAGIAGKVWSARFTGRRPGLGAGPDGPGDE